MRQNDRFIFSTEAAEIAGVTKQAVNKWRITGKFPVEFDANGKPQILRDPFVKSFPQAQLVRLRATVRAALANDQDNSAAQVIVEEFRRACTPPGSGGSGE